MRQRVALAAACACLILCIAFLYICTRSAVASNTETAADGLLKMCRMSAELMDTAAFLESPEEQVQHFSVYSGAGITVISADGYVEQDTRRFTQVGADLSEKPEIILARDNGEGYAVRPFMGTLYIFAARRLSDGRYVRLYQAAPKMGYLVGRRMPLLIGLLILAAVLCYVIVRLATRGLFTFADHVHEMLESFAEGQFSARIPPSPGEPKDVVARINSTAGRIEDQLMRNQRTSQVFSAVVNQMPNGILAVDRDLKVSFVTSSAKQMLGITGSPEGAPVDDASKDVSITQPLRDAMDQDGVYINEVAARTGVGRSHRPLRLYISPMKQDGVSVGAVALIEDITELKRMEQIRTDFAANVSHELKTPLTSIKGFVETLDAGAIEKPEMARKFLRIIMLEADRLTRLINDILTITKFESGTDEVPLQPIPLDQRAYDVCEMLSFHAGEKEVTLHYPQISSPHVQIMGNPDRVQQMLINLIENAIKYNRPGGLVRVSVFASQGSAQLVVADTGIGIAEEHIPRLFERFYRVDKGRSRSMGGTGLGLAIVKHIIKSMDGMIEVHSRLGVGTEFLVTLPLYTAAETETAPDTGDEE